MLSERRIDECTNGAKRSFNILEVLYRNDIGNSRLSILKVFYKTLMNYYSFFYHLLFIFDFLPTELFIHCFLVN